MLASSQKSLKSANVAANLRRLFGFRGGAICQDALVTEDADGYLGGDRDQEVCATYKKAAPWGGPEEEGGRSQGQRGQSDRGWPDLEWV